MRPDTTRILGRSGLALTQMGFGGAPLGNMLGALSDDEAVATVKSAYEAKIRYVDTAPFYGFGLSEHRIGHALRPVERSSFILSTKVGRLIRPKRPEPGDDDRFFQRALPFDVVYDYSYDGVMRSFEDSLQRLGTHRIDVLLVHDIDSYTHGSHEARKERLKEFMAGGHKAMVELRDGGAVVAIGAGINETEACQDLMEVCDFDCFLLAGRYTLLEQGPLDSLFPMAQKRQIGFILGGVYNTGILATGAVDGAYFQYAPAPPEIMERVRRIEQICAQHQVRLASAALQFPLHHPVVTSIIPGMRNPAEVAQNIDLFADAVPADFFAELQHQGLLRADAPIGG